MAVKIRMKRLGRKNRPFYRVCAIDQKTGRDGRVLEELGHYDPLVNDVDARYIVDDDCPMLVSDVDTDLIHDSY